VLSTIAVVAIFGSIALFAVYSIWQYKASNAEHAAVLPTQPRPENMRVDLSTFGSRQLIRWHDCETRVVCYSTERSLDCVKDIEVPWLEEECNDNQ
jgi:acyl-CoA thioesterase